MGFGSKILRVLGWKSSDGDDRKKNKEDIAKKDLLGFDEEEMAMAAALSLSVQDQFRQQDTDRLPDTESKPESSEEKHRAKAQLEEDEQLAKTLQESWSAGSPTHGLKESKRQQAKDQTGEDEQLAKAIQESLNVESPRRLKEDKEKRAEDEDEEKEQLSKAIQESLNMKDDEQLSKAIQDSLTMESSSRSKTRSDADRDPECFYCPFCNKPITDDDKFISKSKRQLSHKSCYKKSRLPKCVICKGYLPSNAAGQWEFKKHPYWKQMYCPSHEADGTPKCCSCERLEPKDTDEKYLKLDDGRELCLECLGLAFMTTDECQALYIAIREYFEGLHMKVEQAFPLLLVEWQALNKAVDGEKHGYHDVITRGLCLSEEQTVRSVLKRPRRVGNRLTDVVNETNRLVRQSEVTAILILYGLPRLLTGSILAHEMMHAWLRLNGYGFLKPEVEEGICQVLAHMWLESETYTDGEAASSSSSSSSLAAIRSKKGKQPEFEKRLCELFKNQIETDSCPVYGVGFRKASRVVADHGLAWTLRYIKDARNLP